MNLTVCILAAGQGKRMHSDLPKVLHRLADKPLVGHVIDTVREISRKIQSSSMATVVRSCAQRSSTIQSCGWSSASSWGRGTQWVRH